MKFFIPSTPPTVLVCSSTYKVNQLSEQCLYILQYTITGNHNMMLLATCITMVLQSICKGYIGVQHDVHLHTFLVCFSITPCYSSPGNPYNDLYSCICIHRAYARYCTSRKCIASKKCIFVKLPVHCSYLDGGLAQLLHTNILYRYTPTFYGTAHTIIHLLPLGQALVLT